MKLTEVNNTAKRKRKKSKVKFNFSSLKKTDIILGSVLLVFVIYAVVMLVSQHSEINKKQAELAEIESQIIIQEINNDEMNDILNSDKDDNAAYIEKTAREDLDYAYKDERIFINISGDWVF